MIIFGTKMALKIDPAGLRRPIEGRRRTQEANQSTKPQTNRPQERAQSARKHKRSQPRRGRVNRSPGPGRGRGGVLQQRKSAGSNAEKPSEDGSADSDLNGEPSSGATAAGFSSRGGCQLCHLFKCLVLVPASSPERLLG